MLYFNVLELLSQGKIYYIKVLYLNYSFFMSYILNAIEYIISFVTFLSF